MAHARSPLILAIDLGSSSVRTAWFSESGVPVAGSSASRKYTIRYTADGGATLDPADVLRAARACVATTLKMRRDSAGLSARPAAGVAGSAFWHSLLGLDHRGRPLTPIYTWADSRSASDATRLRESLSERRIQLRTGCMLRAPYWPAKLRWLRRTDPTLSQRVARWTSPACWIFRELFGVDVSSHSMASGTGLYNLRARRWDPELCALSGIREEQLDLIQDASSPNEQRSEEFRGATIFPALGDGAAGNLGSGADRPGLIAINIGTSAAVREIRLRDNVSSSQPAPGLFAYAVDPKCVVLGGAISNAGNLHQWCLHELRTNRAADGDAALDRRAAADDTLTVLPFWIGERAPSWPPDLGGTIIGLSPTTSATDILRATTTSTFYRLADILERLQTSTARQVIVSGGILHSPASLAMLADALGSDIRICRELESSLRGAAVHALVNLGLRVKPLRPGRIVRHRVGLAAKHRNRRAAQRELERLLTRGHVPKTTR